MRIEVEEELKDLATATTSSPADDAAGPLASALCSDMSRSEVESEG